MYFSRCPRISVPRLFRARRRGNPVVLSRASRVGGMVQRNKTNSNATATASASQGLAHQWESVGRCHAALQSRTRISRWSYSADAAGRAAAPGAGFEWSGSRDGGGAVGRVLPCETMFGGYIDDFVVANKSAMDAYAAKEPMKTEDGHARSRGWPRRASARCYGPNPVTRIIGHGILDLPMIGKYVRAGTYLPVTYHHGRCVGRRRRRGSA